MEWTLIVCHHQLRATKNKTILLVVRGLNISSLATLNLVDGWIIMSGKNLGEQIEQLLENATNPRQRAMTESLPQSNHVQPTKTLAVPINSQPQIAEEKSTTCLENEPNNNPVFKAVGVIQGEVTLGEDRTNSITIEGKNYPMRYAAEKHRTLLALKLEIKKTGNNFQRLIVYPRVVHFPRREQPHALLFELVGFEGSSVEDKGIINDLNDLEFKLCGLWQFIPVCRVPCVSIFRNFTEERKLFIKQAEPYVKLRFMKANHLPLFWRDSQARPFRFNPRLDKDQGRPMFIQVKAKFNPETDQFEFIEELAEPIHEAPRFLKASKTQKGEQRQKVAQPNPSKPSKKEAIDKPKLTRPIKKETKP